MAAAVWCDRHLLTLPIYYGLALSEETFHKELKRLGLAPKDWPAWIKNDHSDATVHRFEHKATKRDCAIVCLRMKPGLDGIQVAALLVHEAVHLWQEFHESIGEHSPSREFEAYSIQSIAQELMNAYVALTKRKKK
jgi:hypothetical protein